MGWMDWGDVRKKRGIRADDMTTIASGDQAANDAGRGVRSDRPRKKKKIKGLGETRKTLTSFEVRKLEGIARKRENGKDLTEAEKRFLKSHGFKVQ